jgi:signal transduction histidine kinase
VPVPGLSDLPRLLEQFGEAGLDVQLTLDGEPDGVPAGVDLSAYRIVQEGLTNALRHGGPQVDLTVAYPGGGVVVEIRNDDRADHDRADHVPGGHGLNGMRERVAVFGGQFEAARQPGGGFRLWATLPFGDPTRVAVGGAA